MLRKKLLSLGLAGVMVASTGVTAFAQNQTLDGLESQTLTGNVTVNGSVNKADGTAAAGKIQVELPTSMAFTVDKDGQFIAANSYTITNRSSVPVDISVKSFNETNPNGGITVHPETESLVGKDRSNITLALVAGKESVDLGGLSKTGNGELGKIDTNSSLNVILSGKAGDTVKQATDSNAPSVDINGESENFTVVFEVKKSTK